MKILTHYGLGDVVWCLRSYVARDRQECQTCAGSGRITLVDAAGEPIPVAAFSGSSHCPLCNGNGRLWLDTERHEATITRLTIGQVRAALTSGLGTEVSYMAEETGVGTGSVYYERELHPSRDAAIDAFFAAHPTGVLRSVDEDAAVSR